MSVNREVQLSCDGGVTAYECDTASVVSQTAAQARTEARERGWLVGQPGGKDYCPEHRPAYLLRTLPS